MAGILSYGAYVPFHRLQRATIGAALGSRAGKGERAVASYDEDTVTMAVEAARDALAAAEAAGTGRDMIGSLLFATTEPPYGEKLNAATVHAALRLEPAVAALDLACSVRAGLGSLRTAAALAATGAPCLATMSDIRTGLPESAREASGGDAAAAFLVGDGPGIAEFEAFYSETLEYMSQWRLPGQNSPKAWEDRFPLTQAYVPLLQHAAMGLLAEVAAEPGDLAAVIVDAPNPRAADPVLRAMELKPEQVAPDFAASVGHTGAADAGLRLAAVLDNAKPGDRIAVLSVSDGVDAVLLRVTDAITDYKRSHTVKGWIDSGRNDLSYSRYLRWRGLMDAEPPRRPDPERPAAPPSFRSEPWKFGFVGQRCNACGTAHLPPQAVCVHCRATNDMADEPFAEKRAQVRTFAVDRLAFTPQPPLVAAIIDFDGGGRVQSELTDCEPEKVAIGDEVEMTFRRLFTAGDIHNYFWKGRPAR
jgi:hydroxymethylglutaryl-CoA synthase